MKTLSKVVSILLFLTFSLSYLNLQAQVEQFLFNKEKMKAKTFIHFYGEDDSLKIEPSVQIKPKPKTFSQEMVFSSSPYHWLFVKNEPSLLKRGDTTIAILSDVIRIGDNVYQIKKGKNIKQWNYFKNNNIVLACSYIKKDGQKYNVLDFRNVPESDKEILTILGLYYGQSIIHRKSRTPAVWGILLAGGIAKALIAD